MDDWYGPTYASGKIEFNKYYMRNASTAKRLNVATHEIGHALGLAHSTSSDVMDPSISSHTSVQELSRNDKDSYDAIYQKYGK